MKDIVKLAYTGSTTIMNANGENIIECHSHKLAKAMVALINEASKLSEIYDEAEERDYVPDIMPFGVLGAFALLEVEL